MRISLGPSVVRSNIDETITGLWTFANVLGLLTDIIGERTAAAGVTVDGLLIRDAGIPEAAVTAHEAALAILESQITPGTLLARVASPETVTGDWTFTERIAGGDGIEFDTLPLTTTFAFLARVLSDTFARFTVNANGVMTWGDGTGARDTNLFRNAANELKTDDGFVVGLALKADGNIHLSERTPASFSTNQNNFETDAQTIQILENTAGAARNVTGFNKGVAGRLIVITIASASFPIVIKHDNASSAAGNRVLCATGGDMTMNGFNNVILWYDAAISRWITLAFIA